MTDPVTIFEVGPRDGLQNEPQPVSTGDKIHLVDLLSRCGLTEIEVASFVSPKWIPQMADAADVMAGIYRQPGTTYSVLTPNLRGFEDARAAGADKVAVFAAASESFSQRNINCSIDASFDRFAPVLAAARMAAIPVRGYISCVTDCPFEGAVDPQAVAAVAQRLHRLGCTEISLGDTIGHGEPQSVSTMIKAVAEVVPVAQLAGHFHNTKGRALANIEASMAMGLRVFDAAAGGLGGCPYAPGAAGNVATEEVVDFMERSGYQTGINRQALAAAAEFAQSLRGRA